MEGARPGRRLLELSCDVQHYAWGDTHFIPSLMGIENRQSRPYAELWMGAHPDLPARADVDGNLVPLHDLIEAAPQDVLGPEVCRAFEGRLPYLFKILSAARPLSIQTHPSKEKAQDGFAREDAAGIPHSARNRNYHDENHKPELITALTDFYALRGFRPLEEIAGVLRDVDELRGLMPDFEPNPASLAKLYASFMNLPQARVDAIIDPLVGRLAEVDATKPFTREDPAYWVLRSDREYSNEGHRDRGLLSVYLLNLVRLKPGEAMYLPAGVLHAYLEGSGLEIMANSNNVLRGGLTPKHVDVAELLANVTFEGAEPEILDATPIPGTRESAFKTPVREFELRRIEIAAGRPHTNGPDHSAEIVILIDVDDKARVTAASGEQTLHLRKGSVFLAPYGTGYAIAADGAATLYKATVPVPVASASGNPAPFFRGRSPAALAFGTSGLRGLVNDITDLEAYVNTRGFLEYLFGIGDAKQGDTVCIAGDLRPSTDSPDRSIMRAVARAIEGAGLRVDNLGRLPTPALTHYAMRHGRASVMITGSHIPFDRNGIKFNKTSGEVLKADEAGILEAVARARRAEYTRPEAASPFRDDGMFKPGESRALPPVNDDARRLYLDRHLDFFPPRGLEGRKILFFQHSAVGRDLLVELLREMGAEVCPTGLSDSFVAIDTEDITPDRIEHLQKMADEVIREHGPIDAVASTDGDSDRPLILGIDPNDKLRFFGGDLVGIVVAEYLDADSISVPISANDAVDLQFAARGIEPAKTRIGSPHVIKSMMDAASAGRSRVVGWEANGGFLTGTNLEKNRRTLEALPTRDAFLPLLAVLFSSIEKGCSLVDLFAGLPPRFSKAGLIDAFPQETSRALIRQFSPSDGTVEDVRFERAAITLGFADGRTEPASESAATEQRAIRDELASCFTSGGGFDDIVRLNTIDGVRIWFRNGDIAHIRPSGNAPQLRIYAVADTQGRADEIVATALREPDGLLWKLEAAVRIGAAAMA
ncbi:MAG: mannose-6-phosphate isomerase, class I [Planctomycetota bacterium]|jgi:mannose-6-phosphate isomerase class I